MEELERIVKEYNNLCARYCYVRQWSKAKEKEMKQVIVKDIERLKELLKEKGKENE